MVLYDEEELQESRRNNTVFALVLIGVVTVSVLGMLLYYELKPLPNTSACKEAGFPAGINKNGHDYCYDSCSDNKIYNCGLSRLLL